MTAEPLRHAKEERLSDPAPASAFARRLGELRTRYLDLWNETSDAEPIPGEPKARRSQWSTYRRAQTLVDFVAGEVESLPDDAVERSAWRRRLEGEIRRFGAERLSWPAGYGTLLLGDEFFDSTVDFVRAARDLDPLLEIDEIGQALRNVWIVNSLQMLLDMPVRMTPAVFAYSLLYPFTDNYLDDPAIELAAKRSFVEQLGHRVAGERIDAVDQRQRRIFQLVGTIEEQFDRGRSPDVFSSLLAIHRAQVHSMKQESRGAPTADEILEISIAKGGASVLADGYLAAGELTPEEADFCFGYGVFLQMLDDLQDARADREVGHQTIFTRVLDGDRGGEPFDATASRLYEFMQRVVLDSRRFGAPRHADSKDLVLRNCSFLLVGAVAEDPDLFSPGFVRRLQRRWPLRFRAMRRLSRRAKQRFSEASRRLCDRRGVESVLDLV